MRTEIEIYKELKRISRASAQLGKRMDEYERQYDAIQPDDKEYVAKHKKLKEESKSIKQEVGMLKIKLDILTKERFIIVSVERLIKFMTANYFLRGINPTNLKKKIQLEFYKSFTTRHKIDGKDFFEMLVNAKFFTIQKIEDRTRLEFLKDLFRKIGSVLIYKQVGTLKGQGIISINPNFDMTKFEEVFKSKETEPGQKMKGYILSASVSRDSTLGKLL